MKNFTQAEADRFASKYKVVGSCWLWTGPLDRDGYGGFFFRGATRRAHRAAWFSMFGEIGEGLVVNHTCRNRNCVNPQHLQCVTATENALKDSSSPAYVNSQKTHCPKGHEYDKIVTWAGKTQRVCSVCDKERRAESKRKAYHKAKQAIRV